MMLEEAMLVSVTLVALGIFGLLSRRDLLRILISAMILLGGITILAVALAASQVDPAASGLLQSFILLAWAIEVAEVVTGIALFIRLARLGKIDLSQMREMRW